MAKEIAKITINKLRFRIESEIIHLKKVEDLRVTYLLAWGSNPTSRNISLLRIEEMEKVYFAPRVTSPFIYDRLPKVVKLALGFKSHPGIGE